MDNTTKYIETRIFSIDKTPKNLIVFCLLTKKHINNIIFQELLQKI